MRPQHLAMRFDHHVRVPGRATGVVNVRRLCRIGLWLNRSGQIRIWLVRQGRRHFQPVFAVPDQRVGLQLRHHFGQGLAQRSNRCPAEQFAGAGDVERVMVVGPVDHPRLDERRLPKHVVLGPGTGFGDERGDIVGFVGLVVDQPKQGMLQFVIVDRLRLADKNDRFGRERCTPLHRSLDGIDGIIHMDERLSVRRLPRVEMTLELPFVNALDLVSQRRKVAAVVVHAREAQDDRCDVAVLGLNDRFGFDL